MKRIIRELPKLVPAVIISVALIAVVLFLIMVSLNSNGSPDARIIISETDPEPGADIIFDATNSSDPEGDELTFHWFFPGEKEFRDPVVKYAFQEKGNYTVVLEVRDSSGNVDSEELSFVID